MSRIPLKKRASELEHRIAKLQDLLTKPAEAKDWLR